MWLTLHDAAMLGNRKGAQAALAAVADVNSVTGQYGFTALHLACLSGSVLCVELLLKAGASVSAVTIQHGYTALHLAARFKTTRHTRCVAALLAAGADPCIRTPGTYGTTALQTAIDLGTFEAACLMLRAAPKAALLAHHCVGALILSARRRKHPCLCLLLPPDLLLEHLPQLWGTYGPLPGLAVALPAALQRSEADAALLVRCMTADDQQQLRTLALSLCAAQCRGLLPQMPAHLVQRLLAECAAQHGHRQLAAQVSREVQHEQQQERQAGT